METNKKKEEIAPLFTDNPTDRTQEIILPEEPQSSPPIKKKEAELSSQKEVKTCKDIPYSTRSSRVTTALLKLDEKERTIVKGLTQGKTEKEALKTAGYSDNYIKTDRKKLINKPSIQEALAIIMENTGISDEFMMGKLKKGMDAQKTIVIKGGKDEADKIIKTDDHAVIHKFIETGLKLKGHLDKKVDIVHHKSHEDQLRELQGDGVMDADYEEILPE